MTAISPSNCRARPGKNEPPTRRQRREGRGQSTVEFSLILWPFLLLLLATCDYAQIYFYESSLRHAIREAGRSATTGQVKVFKINGVPQRDTNDEAILMTSKYSPPLNMSRNETVREIFKEVCLIDLEDSDILITSWPGTNNATEASPNNNSGIAEDYMRIEVSWPLALITPVAAILEEDSEYTVTVESIFRNEPSQNFNDYTNKYPNEP